MRLLPVFLSVVLHVAVIAFGVLYHPAPKMHVDLRKRTYTVDLVKLQAPAEKKKKAPTAGKPPSLQKADQAPKPASSRARPDSKAAVPAPKPKPKPKKIVNTAKKVPETAPARKISPKKRPEPKRKKPAPAKPERKAPPKPKPPVRKTPKGPSAEEIMAAALGEAKKAAAKAKPRGPSAQEVLAREIASLKKSVGDAPVAGSARGAAEVEKIFGIMVEDQVKEHWRFPRLGNLGLSAVVEVVVDPAGRVVSKRVVTSSGRADFDASTLRAVEEAGDLPSPPERKQWTVRITFNLAEQG
jgi:colicin import membrane protein